MFTISHVANSRLLQYKQLFPACSTGFPTTGMSSEMTNPAYLQFNPVQQLVSCCGLEMGMNTPDMAFRRTMSAPLSLPETYLDTSYITVIVPILLYFRVLLPPLNFSCFLI